MSDIRVGSSIRSQAMSDTSAHVPEGKRDPGTFTRKAEDGVGRPHRGSIQTTGLTRRQQISPAVFGFFNAILNHRYNSMTAGTGSRRNEISLTLVNGDTAVITGDEQNRNVLIRTRRGVVVEANFGSNGAHAVRGIQTPRDLRDLLSGLYGATGWENARALPDR